MIRSVKSPCVGGGLNCGTPELVTGITAEEIRNLIGLGTSNSPTFSTTSTAVVDFTSSLWTIQPSGNDLLFKYNGANRFKMTSAGAFSAVDDIIAEATI